MNFQQALHYLKTRERYGIKFGLENIDRLAEALDRPERRFDSILIAGTNGKGSTAALLESILRAGGRRTGLYTSPHIRSILERIRVDGSPISEEELASAVGRVFERAHLLWRDEPHVPAPTFFEAVTGAGFVAFSERAVETAVLEVGMGGRYDATNIVGAAIAVITPIGFDHERFLGTTLPAIAAEKAAIIKETRPVVVGRLAPEALAVVRAEAERRNAPLLAALEGVELDTLPEELGVGQRVRLRTPSRDYGEIALPLEGDHQVDNLVLAVRTAEVYCPSLRADDVRRGVARTSWPGRLERIAGCPPLLLDAAHNVMAAETLARHLARHPHPGRVLLFGVMKDKRVYEMLEILLPHVRSVVVTRPAMSRARPPERLARWIADRGVSKPEAISSTPAALARARALAGEEGEVLVAGSIFLLGEVTEALERERAAPAIAGL